MALLLRFLLPNRSFYMVSQLLCCLLYGTVAAQQQRFLLYDAGDGLPNNNIHTITRSADGLVWLGTQDGLCSFDGNQFQVYKHNESDSNSISDQFVLYIKEDAASGNLWIGTRSGLNYFNRKTRRFRRFYLDEQEKHVFQSSYNHFFVQQDGRLVLHNKGLHMLDAATGIFTRLPAGNDQQLGWLLQPDYSGWSFNRDNRIYHYPDVRRNEHTAVGTHSLGHSLQAATLKSLQLNDSVVCLHSLQQLDTLYFFNTGSQNMFRKLPVPRSSSDVCLSGSDLLLCNAEGLFRLNPSAGGQWQRMQATAANGLPSSSFLSACSDKEGNIWLGSAGAGLAVNNPSLAVFTSIPTFVPNERINAITVSGNTLYAGTYSGLYRIKDLSAKAPPVFDRMIGGKFVSAVTTDRQQRIWVAVRNEGIWLLSPSGRRLRLLTLPEAQKGKTIFHLSTDPKGRVLISTAQGFFYADPAGDMRIRFIDSSGPVKPVTQYYLGSYTDNAGNTWLSGYHGIDILNENMVPVRSLKSFRDNESFLQRTIVTAVTQDKQGVYWIATIRNGVYRYTGSQFTH